MQIYFNMNKPEFNVDYNINFIRKMFILNIMH